MPDEIAQNFHVDFVDVTHKLQTNFSMLLISQNETFLSQFKDKFLNFYRITFFLFLDLLL